MDKIVVSGIQKFDRVANAELHGAHISIPITKGYATLVSPEDSDLAGFKWFAQLNKNTTYAVRDMRSQEGEPRTRQYLHRVIFQRIIDRLLARDECVNHRDGNGLNNHRENLRLATHIENTRNQRKSSANTSGHKGVCWHKHVGKWMAQIGDNGKIVNLGYFDDIKDAAAAYREAAAKYHGEFANCGDET